MMLHHLADNVVSYANLNRMTEDDSFEICGVKDGQGIVCVGKGHNRIACVFEDLSTEE